MKSVMLYPCIDLSMSLLVLWVACLTVRMNCLVKQFTIFWCGCYLVVQCYESVECGWRCSVG